MYEIGVFANISELMTYKNINLLNFFDKFKNKEQYHFSIYTKEQKELFMAKVQTLEFDGIVFTTNTSNDASLRAFFECDVNKKLISRFLSFGKGVLVLMQYQLAMEGESFNILLKDENDFPELEHTPIKAVQNNDDANLPVVFDKNKRKFNDNNGNLLLHYPREILGSAEYSYDKNMEANNWQGGRTPFFVVINQFPEDDFYSLIDYKDKDDDDQENKKKSLCIVSRNSKKRVIISAQALDFQENFLLENLISYIARGEPTIFFKECGKCGVADGNSVGCDLKFLFNTTNIHFSDDPIAEQFAKYSINNCSQSLPIERMDTMADMTDNIIPVKHIFANNGRVFRSTNVSAIQYICKLGAQYLRARLKDGKYGSLMGTHSTLRFFDMIGVKVNADDRKTIFSYLKSHNKDGETFDVVAEPTRVANEILKFLKYDKTKDKQTLKFVLKNSANSSRDMSIETLIKLPIRESAKAIVEEYAENDNYMVLTSQEDDDRKKEFLFGLFAEIICKIDQGKISWEDDCYMTSLMLSVLTIIEKWIAVYDKKYKTDNISKLNLLATYFEELSDASLCTALVQSVDAERQEKHNLANKLMKELSANQELKEENSKLKKDEKDYELLENKVRQKVLTNIISWTMTTLIIMLFVIKLYIIM